MTGKTFNNGNTKNVEIAVPLKYFSNFWRTLEMSLINCEINWVINLVIINSTGARTFAITDTKCNVPVVTSSTQDNVKLLQQLKSGFKRAINWNKYLSKKSIERQKPYLDYLIDPSFQGVNRLFDLSFKNNTDRTVHTGNYLPKVEIKDYNVMIDGKKVFEQPVKYDMVTHDNMITKNCN